MENDNTEPTSFEHVPPPHPVSAEIENVIEAIKKLSPDQVIAYDEIAGLIGEKPKTDKFRSIVQRAIHKLVYEYGIGARVVRGIGVRQETSEGITKHSARAIPAIRRKVLRERRRLKCANIEELNPEGQTQYILTSSMFGVLLTISAPRFVGKLEVKCVDAANAIPARSVMTLFLKTNREEPENN